MHQTGVYSIVNVRNGKAYVGSAVVFHDRWRRHRNQLRANSHHSVKLQRAWNKYGEEAFEFRKLLICSKENLIMYEQKCIDGYDSARKGYNVSPTAGNTLGIGLDPETHAKMSARARGKKHSAETRAKLSAIGKGKTVSESARALISIAHRGNSYNLGRKASAETRAKLSQRAQCRVGRPHSQQTKDRIAAINTGKTQSAETRAKRSASLYAANALIGDAEKEARRISRMNNPKRARSPETRAKISATKRARFAAGTTYGH